MLVFEVFSMVATTLAPFSKQRTKNVWSSAEAVTNVIRWRIVGVKDMATDCVLVETEMRHKQDRWMLDFSFPTKAVIGRQDILRVNQSLNFAFHVRGISLLGAEGRFWREI